MFVSGPGEVSHVCKGETLCAVSEIWSEMLVRGKEHLWKVLLEVGRVNSTTPKLYIKFFNYIYLFNLCVCLDAYACHGVHLEVREQLEGVGSFLVLSRSRD